MPLIYFRAGYVASESIVEVVIAVRLEVVRSQAHSALANARSRAIILT